jgi:hypothetical protein
MKAIIAIYTAFLLVIVSLALIGTANRAFAHSWYDPHCCSDKDCAPVTHSQRTVVNGIPGEIMTSKIGTTFVPDSFKSVYPSRDAELHICMTLPTAEPNSGDIAPSRPICVYKPMMF